MVVQYAGERRREVVYEEDVRSAQPCCLCRSRGKSGLWCSVVRSDGVVGVGLAAVTGKGFERVQRRLVVRCI